MAVNKYSHLPDAPPVTIYNAGGGSGKGDLKFSTLARGQYDMYMRTIDRLSDREQAYREQELRQVTVVDKPEKIKITVSREDFPAISAEFDVIFVKTAAQQAWAKLLREVCLKLNLQFIEIILDRYDKSPVFRIMSLRAGGEYLARQRESSAILEVINTGVTPAEISWPITKDINNVKRNLEYDGITMPTITHRVGTLVRKKMTRESQRQAAHAIATSLTPIDAVTAIEDFHRNYDPNAPEPTITLEAAAATAKRKEAKGVGLYDVDLAGLSPAERTATIIKARNDEKTLASRTSQAEAALAEAEAQRKKKPLPPFGDIAKYDQTVDIVTLHRLCFEKLGRFVAQGFGKEVAAYQVLMYVRNTITELRAEVDLVALGLKIISEIIKYLKDYREQIYHLVLDCIAAYAPPEAAHRKRNPKRLLPPDQPLMDSLGGGTNANTVSYGAKQTTRSRGDTAGSTTSSGAGGGYTQPGSRGGSPANARRRGKKSRGGEEKEVMMSSIMQQLGVMEINNSGQYQDRTGGCGGERRSSLAQRYGMFFQEGIGCEPGMSMESPTPAASISMSGSRSASRLGAHQTGAGGAVGGAGEGGMEWMLGAQSLLRSPGGSGSTKGTRGTDRGFGMEWMREERFRARARGAGLSRSLSQEVHVTSGGAHVSERFTVTQQHQEQQDDRGSTGLCADSNEDASEDDSADGAQQHGRGGGPPPGESRVVLGALLKNRERARTPSVAKKLEDAYAIGASAAAAMSAGAGTAAASIGVAGRAGAGASAGPVEDGGVPLGATIGRTTIKKSSSGDGGGAKKTVKIVFKVKDKDSGGGKGAEGDEKKKAWSGTVGELGRKAPKKIEEKKIDFKKKIVYDPSKDKKKEEEEKEEGDGRVGHGDTVEEGGGDGVGQGNLETGGAVQRVSAVSTVGASTTLGAVAAGAGRGGGGGEEKEEGREGGLGGILTAGSADAGVSNANTNGNDSGTTTLPAAFSTKKKQRKPKVSYRPLPTVACVEFRGLSGKLKQNIAMQQCFATLYKTVSFSYGNRDRAFRMGVAEEVSVIATVCQAMPRVLEYYMWTVDCMYRDGFGEMTLEDMEGAPSDDPTMAVSADGDGNPDDESAPAPASVVTRTRVGAEAGAEAGLIGGSMEGRVIETMSELSLPSIDNDGTFSEATRIVTIGEIPSEEQQAAEAAAAALEDNRGSTRGSVASRAASRKASTGTVGTGGAEGSMLVTEAAVDKNERDQTSGLRKARLRQIQDEIGLFEFERRYTARPDDVVVIAVAMVSSHNEIETREKEMANRWLDVWDDGTLDYKIVKKKGKDIAGL